MYSGRPFGGVALLWHKSLQIYISPIESGSDRIAAAVVCQGRRRVLMMAVYMPVDYGNQESFDNFLEQLGNLDDIYVICEL